MQSQMNKPESPQVQRSHDSCPTGSIIEPVPCSIAAQGQYTMLAFLILHYLAADIAALLTRTGYIEFNSLKVTWRAAEKLVTCA